MQTNKEKATKMLNDDFDGVMNHHKIAHECIEIAATPDVFDTRKGEFPSETAMYLAKANYAESEIELAYFRKELKTFFTETSKYECCLWTNIPNF